MLRFLLSFLFLFVFLPKNYAQEEATEDSTIQNNTVDTVDTYNDEEWHDWEKNWDNSWSNDWNFNFWRAANNKPCIVLNYGLSKMSLKKFNHNFTKPDLAEIKVGYVDESKNSTTYILEYHFKYLSLSNISTNLSKTSKDLENDLWRVNLGWSSGLGYRIGPSAIIPYSTYNLTWNYLNMLETPNDSSRFTLNRFNKTLRFGNAAEGGIIFKIVPQIGIQVGYEKALVYQKHLFWKWAGSAVIELGLNGVIDNFVEKIKDSSPAAAPIVGFVLKNGLAYGLYELRKDKMNWPFKGEPALAYDQFKIGLNFIF